MFLRVLLLIQMMLLLGMINNFTVSEHGTVQYHPGTRVLIICVKKGKGPPQQGSRGGGFSALAAVRRDEQLHLLSFGRPLAQPLGRFRHRHAVLARADPRQPLRLGLGRGHEVLLQQPA